MTSVAWIYNSFNGINDPNSITKNTVGKYYKVTSFSAGDSKAISDALSSSNDSVYLSDNGGVVSINYTRNFKNNLTNTTQPNRSGNSKISLSPGNNKYVFSKPFGSWVLYRKTENEMFLLYNPVPRRETNLATANYGVKNVKEDIIRACKINKATDPV